MVKYYFNGGVSYQQYTWIFLLSLFTPHKTYQIKVKLNKFDFVWEYILST